MTQLIETPAARLDRRAWGGLWEPVILGLLLLSLTTALVWQAWRLGITVDEPSHLLSSHLYWQGADRLEPRDLPPLIKITCGWVPGLVDIAVPFDIRNEKETRTEWDLSQAMMERMPAAAIQWMFFWTRLPLVIFPVLTALLLWYWSRQLWGRWVALTAATLYALEPTALGHGALIKNDIAATFTYLLFWFMAWRFWRAPSMWPAAGLGAATLLTLLSKMSMLWLAGVAPLVVIAGFWRMRAKPRVVAAAAAVVLLLPYAGALAASQFETRRIPAFELAALQHDPLLPKPFLAGAQVFRILPVPVPMWKGTLNLIRNNGQVVPVYLLGEMRPEGSRWYFLVALLLKAPLPVLLLVAGGLAASVHVVVRGRVSGSSVFWLAPGLLYIALASLSNLQLGVRLILPALPFGLLTAGCLIHRLYASRRAALISVVALAWTAVSAVRAYPNSITYFNEAAGGPQKALEYLADSNVDWGQGLPELAEYVKANRIPKVRFAYFGSDSPWRFFNDRQAEPVPVPWSPGMVKESELVLEPGYYAISATLLPGHFFPPAQRQFFRTLRRLRPEAIVANSIYVYRVDQLGAVVR